jgi:hypothetical protein
MSLLLQMEFGDRRRKCLFDRLVSAVAHVVKNTVNAGGCFVVKFGALVLGLAAALASMGGFMIYQAKRVKTNDVGLDFSQPHHFVTPAMEVETQAMKNRLEPEILAKTELGKPITLAARGASRPEFVLFIKDACPCSIDAQPIFNKLAERFQPKVQFVGVIDGDEAAAERFASQFSVEFPVVGDRDLKAIRGFGAQAGVFSALVAKSGHLIKMWPGYSASLLGEMNHQLAEVSGTKEIPFDPEYAPKVKTTGCAYASDWGSFGAK